LDAGIQQEMGDEIMLIRKPHFYHFDDFEITRIGEKFDFILAQSVLSHAGVDAFEKIVREASKSLKSGGVFAATYFDGAQSNQRGWLGHGIATYPFGFVKATAMKYDLVCKPISIKHPVGQKWVRFLA
jgi:2-polyprenyl-3-methyl-5-hydroxy-6-metoxy-1,4-benzoquinol methylase